MSPHPERITESPNRFLGGQVWHYSELASTNNLALELGQSLDVNPRWHGLALRADRQTSGRGQHNRVWEAPARRGVLLSVLLDPPAHCRRPAILTSWVAVAVSRVVESVIGWRPDLKWPNDVLVRGQKIAGILVEQRRGTVVGIGLNVWQTADEFAAAGLPDATSLVRFVANPPDVVEMTEKLLDAMDLDWRDLEQGNGAAVERRWREGLGLTGRPVRAVARGDTILGYLEHLGWDEITLRLENGTTRSFQPEEISALAALDGVSSG